MGCLAEGEIPRVGVALSHCQRREAQSAHRCATKARRHEGGSARPVSTSSKGRKSWAVYRDESRKEPADIQTTCVAGSAESAGVHGLLVHRMGSSGKKDC